ncbi:MAG TPA: FAD-dependent oxidoreductase [Candidatus Eremiobacteraceae bacterium]|nr:FAD-dependent oxidoreductase [Candidatus Eremiobacteraceae bacterium]
MERVDVIVIGSGQGGVPFAVDRAKRGDRVVLFDRGRLGGSCVNYGCTPSKTFLAAAHTAGRARHGKTLGVRGDVSVDFGATIDRVRSVVGEWRDGVEKKVAAAGIEVVRAEASFTGERIVTAGGQEFTAPLILIDTGTSPLVPHVPGLAGTPYMTNVTFFDQRVLPKRLLVMGGGYIGLELGQGMARCGCQVHIIDSNARVLAREEADASEALTKGLLADGISLHLSRKATEVKHDGGFEMTLDDGSKLSADALLVATGRVPNTAALQAEKSGIALDKRGYIGIDSRFATSCQGVYAIGDVAGQPAFTHVSWEDHRRLEDILAGGVRTRDDRVLGYSTYTEPQVARVGMTAEEAKQTGRDVRAVTLPLSEIARGIEWDQQNGFFRLVVDGQSEKILGATMVGYETAELVHVILAHMEAGSTWRVLERSVHIHPTFAEGLPSLARLLT